MSNFTTIAGSRFWPSLYVGVLRRQLEYTGQDVLYWYSK